MRKKIFYYSVQTTSILLTVFLLTACLFFGYIFYCNIVEMEIPTLGSFQIYVVLSDSMAPFMVKNDAIIVNKTDASKLKAGDVITFYAFESDTVVTHRITEIAKTEGGPEFVTKGDNNNAADNFTTSGSRVIGKYVFRLPQFGGFLTSIKNRPYVVILPIALIILIQLMLGYIETKLKPEPKKKKIGYMEKPQLETAKTPEIEIKEQPAEFADNNYLNNKAQTLLKKILGEARIELDQIKKEAQTASEKLIGEAETEAEQIRKKARSEIILMKHYADKMLEEANAKLAEAQNKAQKIIAEAKEENSIQKKSLIADKPDYTSENNFVESLGLRA
jgi:signal peptidase